MSFWETLSEIVRTLLIMSATGGVVALLLFVLKPIIKNRIPKSGQYYLWSLVLVAFLIPFSVFVSLPFATPMARLQEVIDENVQTTVERRDEIAQERYGMEYEALDAEKQIDISYNEIGLMKGSFLDYVLSALITMGGVAFLIDVAQYAAYTAKLRRRRIDARSSETALLSELCKGNKRPRLYRNALASTPMLLGVFRPVIYLPDREFSESQLQNILLHELTHLRRHDVAVKWISAVAVYVHWFNPLAYLARREIARACELACDETVISSLDNEGKQGYGDTLIEMASDAKVHRILAATTMCEEKKTLKDRLDAIMKNKKATRKAILLASTLVAFILCVTVLLGAGTVVDKYSQEELALLSVDTTPPDGLFLEITSAASDDIEFHLINATDMNISEYGYVNKVEMYDGEYWRAATTKTIDIFPPTRIPLQPGMDMYGMAAWVAEDLTFAPGVYRYLMVVHVSGIDGDTYPVVLKADFEIAN